MDRFWAILQWIVLLLVLIGVLRYYQGANALGTTFFTWFYNESKLLAGLNPNTGAVANYPTYQQAG